jgi:hypothetical protein
MGWPKTIAPVDPVALTSINASNEIVLPLLLILGTQELRTMNLAS